MSIGSLTGHLEREQRQLREINSALLALEAQALGRISDFGLSDKDVSRNQRMLLDFAVRLRSALDQETTAVDIQPLVYRLRSDTKPLEDWRQDLDELVAQLQSKEQLKDGILTTLEEVVSLLATEFTEDLHRLYTR